MISFENPKKSRNFQIAYIKTQHSIPNSFEKMQNRELKPPMRCCGRVWFTYPSAYQHCKQEIHLNRVKSFADIENPILCEMKRLKALAEIRVRDSEDITFRNDSQSGRIGLNIINEMRHELNPETSLELGKTMVLERDLNNKKDKKTEGRRDADEVAEGAFQRATKTRIQQRRRRE